MNGFIERFPALHYHRKIPQGVDHDYDVVVRLSSGRYCWLMTDDDIVLDGAVSSILTVAEGDYALLVVNAEVRDLELNQVLEERRIQLATDRIYTPDEFGDLFVTVGAHLSFIGGVIIRRDIWCSRNSEKYFGTEFVHIGVIFQSILPASTYVFARPYIRIRYGNAHWTGRGFRMWMFNWPGIIWSLTTLSDAEKRLVADPAPWRRIRELVKFRAKGAYSIREYNQHLRSQTISGYNRVIALLVALAPGLLVNCCAMAWLRLFYPNALALRLEFEQSRYYLPNLFRFLSP